MAITVLKHGGIAGVDVDTGIIKIWPHYSYMVYATVYPEKARENYGIQERKE